MFRLLVFFVVVFLLFLSFGLIGCRDHAYYPLHLQFSFFLAYYNVSRFVASFLFCVRLQLNSILLSYIYFDVEEIKDTTTSDLFFSS